MWHESGCACAGCDDLRELAEQQHRATPVAQLVAAAESNDEDEVREVVEWLGLSARNLGPVVAEAMEHLGPEEQTFLASIAGGSDV